MIFKASNPPVPAIWMLSVFMTACSQPPNYAPVKTVNQAIAPDNGYTQEQYPTQNTVAKARQKENGVPENPKPSTAKAYENKSYQRRTNKPAQKEITPNNVNKVSGK